MLAEIEVLGALTAAAAAEFTRHATPNATMTPAAIASQM